MISYIKFNNNSVNFLLNKMKIKLFLEVMNFIDTNDINNFALLFIFFNKDVKKFVKYHYIFNNLPSDDMNIKNILFPNYESYLIEYTINELEILDKLNSLDELKRLDTYDKVIKDKTKDELNIIDDILNSYVSTYNNFLTNNLDKFEYILFIIIYETIITKEKLDNILEKYIDKSLKLYNYYLNLLKSYKYGYDYFKLDKLTLKIKSNIKKIIKYIFLTNYIDINNTYTIYCINIYLYEMKKLNKTKETIIITLLARLLLQTNTFYLNNYTNYLNIDFSIDDEDIDDKSFIENIDTKNKDTINELINKYINEKYKIENITDYDINEIFIKFNNIIISNIINVKNNIILLILLCILYLKSDIKKDDKDDKDANDLIQDIFDLALNIFKQSFISDDNIKIINEYKEKIKTNKYLNFAINFNKQKVEEKIFYLLNQILSNILNTDKIIDIRFIDIYKTIINIIRFDSFISFKNSLYKTYNDEEPIKFIINEDINVDDDFLSLSKMIKGGKNKDINLNFILKDPTYILNHIPMNNSKRNKLIKFIEKNLE
jgi:hypothetical protein